MALLCGLCILGTVYLGVMLIYFVARVRLPSLIGVCTSQKRLDGKVVIITGGNSGIGKEAAKDLARRGAKIILACRNIQKAENVAVEIRTDYTGCQVTVKKLDLCSLHSIREFVEQIFKEETRLDVLINNAGLFSDDVLRLTEDGFEEVYQSNYLGTVYLTEFLMPLLKKSAPSRIVSTGSIAHLLGKLDLAKLPYDVKTLNKGGGARYADTKLALLMWTRGMADELQDSGVTINVLHPGIVHTSITERGRTSAMNSALKFIIWIFGRSCVEGAQTIIHLSVADEVKNSTGGYWEECSRVKFLVRPKNKEANRQLLKTTRKILGLK